MPTVLGRTTVGLFPPWQPSEEELGACARRGQLPRAEHFRQNPKPFL